MSGLINAFFRFKKFLWYQRVSRTKYYLHSPFVYQFYLNVLEGNEHENIVRINALRKSLRDNNALVELRDLGTSNLPAAKISDIEKRVAVSEKTGLALYRLVHYFKPQYIIETGTSTGISSLYLATAYPPAKIITLEGSEKLKAVAQKNYAQLGVNNIEVITGNFDDTLKLALDSVPVASMVFFDGNHTKPATLRYFRQCLEKSNENSIFVFDDIYWSREMAEAWEEIKGHPQISLTIDIYRLGICFFIKEKLAKESFVLRY